MKLGRGWDSVAYALCHCEISGVGGAMVLSHSAIIETQEFLETRSNPKPSQAKVLTGAGDLRFEQVDIPLSVSHSCV